MNVQIEVLRRGTDVPRILQNDGWVLGHNRVVLSASHPEVANESEARHRLYRLGILTSRGLRIAFPPSVSR